MAGSAKRDHRVVGGRHCGLLCLSREEFSKPKVNRLQQTSAYFDALEAEERANQAQQQAKDAQQQKHQMYAQNARNWVLNKLDFCVAHNDDWSTKFCNVSCVNDNYKTKQGVWVNFVAGSWQGTDAPGYHASPTTYYQAACANL